jgi:hypothetical protein
MFMLLMFVVFGSHFCVQELHMYSKSTTKAVSPLVYWKRHVDAMPHLAKAAAVLFALSPTSCPTERQFSHGRKSCELTFETSC